MYYLQSRYYNPEWGRFINADNIGGSVGALLSHNVFAYCNNNPVNKMDPSGYMATEATIAAMNWWNPVGWIAAAVLVVEVAIVVHAAYETANAVKSAVETASDIINTRDQSVYALTDPNDGDKVKYIGRTNNPGKRKKQHDKDKKHPERKGYDMKVIATGLNIPAAKATKQVMISAFTLSYLENARREIGLGNIDRFKSNMGAVVSIFESIPENELMNLMGQ